MEGGILASEMTAIQRDCSAWLGKYRNAYGPEKITPYVHIIGTHLPLMLQQCGYSIGEWSQQGFEACHKVVRRIFHHCTSQGGSGKSALLQIEEYLYRRSWALLRHQFCTLPIQDSEDGENAEIIQQLHRFADEELFFPLDGNFHSAVPAEAIRQYVIRRAAMTVAKIKGKWEKDILRTIASHQV
jgi:hypothetical protein